MATATADRRERTLIMTDDAAALAATYFRAWKAHDFAEFRSGSSG
jgi:hypothetical protein